MSRPSHWLPKGGALYVSLDGYEELQKALHRLQNPGSIVRKAWRKERKRLRPLVKTHVKNRFHSRPKKLFYSYQVKVLGKERKSLIDTAMIVYSAVPEIANIHEFGGTIRPKHGKYLAIATPLAGRLKGGPMRLKPRMLKGKTFVVKSKRHPGNLVIMQKQEGGTKMARNKTIRVSRGKGKPVWEEGEAVPMFTLTPRVKIKRRTHIRGLMKTEIPHIAQTTLREVEQTFLKNG